MKNGILITGILMLLCFTGCRQKSTDPGNSLLFTDKTDISYGTESDQRMDLYLPKKTAGKEVFIIIHGGGWRGGRRSQLTVFTHRLMEKFPGHIFVNTDYRLASTSRYALPDQTDDIQHVIDYLEKTLPFEPNYILLGNSAGAHLSMLYAYRYDREKKVKAVINIVGPADLSNPGFKSYEDYAFVEKHLVDPEIIKNNISLMNFGSPAYWIDKTSAPTLSFYGTKDTVVPASQMKVLDSSLQRHQVSHESYTFNGNHVEWQNEPNASFLISKIELFLRHISKTKTP
ncbi:alpha/beta hydrolase [Chryseobacterium sp. JJR-5R]|uniref:alpha/beta hydrolase n=1 Tax=Chryseobacterium sp. JJR-5R TaxID=3093923 RepID=UPI002A764E0A|nr:alpha/beta hydrolase [Chryseobacterium sp. JJR-5R]WPO83180.1 alpha/beta hydrolase [Chryseobacterium sp. JJR-5R]